MANVQDPNATNGINKEYTNGTNGTSNGIGRQMTQEEHQTAQAAARFGYGPLAHVNNSPDRLPAFGGEFQPGTYRPVADRKFANPAPLGLSAFALTTFILSLINMNTRGVSEPNIVVGAAFGYGGLVQLLAGMWEMAIGNTFGATALSSYGGFWIAVGIILTPGGFQIAAQIEGPTGDTAAFYNSFGFFMLGWFIFTTILLLVTLRSTVAFFLLFFFLDLAFLLLGIAYLEHTAAGPDSKILKAGGLFGLLAAFMAWYNALAGMADDSNSFFVIPVAHFPWSVTGREKRVAAKNERATV